MLQLFVLTFTIVGLAFIGMAMGVIFSQKELKGSCGGLSNIPGFGDSNCSCLSPCEKQQHRHSSGGESGLVQYPVDLSQLRR